MFSSEDELKVERSNSPSVSSSYSKSSPIRTLSLSERSPMILLTGGGRILASVGVAKISRLRELRVGVVVCRGTDSTPYGFCLSKRSHKTDSNALHDLTDK